MVKIWAHSGDSHFLEPEDLWHQILPAALAERMPLERARRRRRDRPRRRPELRRKLPKLMTKKGADGLDDLRAQRAAAGRARHPSPAPGPRREGIWGEVIYPSLGLWTTMIKDPELVREPPARENEWMRPRIQGVAPDRLVPTAQLCRCSTVEDAVAELEHAADDRSARSVTLPTGLPAGADDYNHDSWEPLWAATDEAGMVLGFHIGTDGSDHRGRCTVAPVAPCSTTSRRRSAGRRRR